MKTTLTKTAVIKQALAKTAAQHPSKKTESVIAKTPDASTYTQPVSLNTYRQPISPVHTVSAAPLPAFTTSGGSLHSESTFKITVPQSASVTPPISSFGKSSSMPTTFNTSSNASLPSQRPIYVNETPNGPETRAKAALVLDENNLKILYERNSTSRMPMASITKLMTALVVVETMQDMNQVLEISDEDIDWIKGTGSRLKIGTRLTRREMLHLALMSSENRAASALGRYYPGGREAFVNAMNLKAAVLGMTNTRFVDTNGLSPQNVSCARDLAKLVMAAAEHPLIRKYSTAEYHTVYDGEKNLSYGSTNRLTHSSNWKIQVQKTGYIREAGQCLVMKTTIDGRPIVMVLLNVVGPKGARIVDAQQIKNWLTHSNTTSSSFFSSNRTSSNRNTSFSEDDFYN
ncbi:MAG: D-alanyl-D-alanine carboxypeptidase family protein [Oxalobacter sp.]